MPEYRVHYTVVESDYMTVTAATPTEAEEVALEEIWGDNPEIWDVYEV